MADDRPNLFNDNVEKRQEIISKYQSNIRAKYGMTFRDGIGREVLGDILALCGFPGATGEFHNGFDPNNPSDIGRLNVGIEIAAKAGVLRLIGTHILGIVRETKEE